MRYISLEDTTDFKFTTVDASGAPSTLGESPAVSVYPGNSTDPITDGVTLTADFDSVTGLNHVRVVATDDNGFAAGTEYILVVTAGEVDGQSIAGYVVGEFATSPVPANVIQVDGEAVESTEQIDANVTSVGGQAVAGPDDLKADVTGLSTFNHTTNQVTVATNNDKSGYALSTAAIQSIWDRLTSALTTVGSIGKLLVDNINASITSRSSHSAADVWASGTRTLTAGTKDTEIDAIKEKTDQLTSDRVEKLDRDLAHASDADTYKADVSGLATSANVSTAESNIRGGSETLESLSTKIDAIETGEISVEVSDIIQALMDHSGFTASGDVSVEDVFRMWWAFMTGNVHRVDANTFRVKDDDGQAGDPSTGTTIRTMRQTAQGRTFQL